MEFPRPPSLQLSARALACALCLAPFAAAAQKEAPQLLEEIVVTAQKREQAALDVPIAISAFSARDVLNTGALTLQDIADYIPGLETGGETFTQQGYAIRGVSSPNISTGGDPSVATFYDDMYLPRAATTVPFADLERVEVLKGPQGTLFGRNAAAGVIRLVPNSPGKELEGFARARIGNYNLVRVEGMANIPAGENFALRANVLYNTRNGISKNVGPRGKDAGEKDNWAARLAARWEISEGSALQLAADVDRFDQAPTMAIGFSPYAYGENPFAGRYENDVIADEETRDMLGITGKLFHEINPQLRMKWVGGYRGFETTNRQDEDGTADPTRYFDTNNIEDSSIAYTELQFNYKRENISVVFGANYSLEDTYQRTDSNALGDSITRLVTNGLNAQLGANLDHLWNPAEFAAALSAVAGLPVTGEQVAATGDMFYDLAANMLGLPLLFGPSFRGMVWNEAIINEGDFTNWGLYGDLEYQLTERLQLIAGLRYSRDRKEFNWLIPNTNFAAQRPGVTNQIFTGASGQYASAADAPFSAEGAWNAATWRGVAAYTFSEDLLGYASYSSGYKAGGFDSLRIESAHAPLRPEDSDQWELGLKGSVFNNRVQMEFALFGLDVAGRQRSIETRPPDEENAIPTVINVDQSVFGAELKIGWLVLDNLLLSGLGTRREDEQQSANFYNARAELTRFDTKGNTANDFTLMLDWTPELPVGGLAVHAEYIFKENTRNPDDPDFNPAYRNLPGYLDDTELVNLRVAWIRNDDKLELALWGRNLLDEERITGVREITASQLGTPFAGINTPLTWGVDAIYRY